MRFPGVLLVGLFLTLSAAEAPLPGGTLVVVHQQGDTALVIDAATGEIQARLPTGRLPHEVAISPDGRYAAVTNYGKKRTPGTTVTLIDLAIVRVKASLELDSQGHLHGVSWTPDGRIAVVSQDTGDLVLVDPTGEIEPIAMPSGREWGELVAVTPDGRLAFVSNLSANHVSVIDLISGKAVKTIPTGSGPEGLAVTPDGKEVWVATRAADELTVIDVEKLEIVTTVPCPGFPVHVAVTPDGSRVLVTCSRGNAIVAFDAATRREVARTKLDLTKPPGGAAKLAGGTFGAMPIPMALTLSSDGSTAYVAADLAEAVMVIDVATLELRDVIAGGIKPDGIAYSPLGSVTTP